MGFNRKGRYAMRSWLLGLFCVCFVIPSSGFAQQARYQLGKQVIGFETAFQQNMSKIEARRAVLPSLERAVQAFFSMSFAGAEKSIDDAWLKLLPDDQQSQAASLIPLRLNIANHWHDTNTEELEIELSSAYESKSPLQLPVTLQVEFADSRGKRTAAQTKSLTQLPYKEVFSIKDLVEGDWGICVTLECNGIRWTLPSQIVSRTGSLEARLSKAKEGFEQQKSKEPDTKQRSLQLMLNVLRDLKNGRTLETDFPAHQILQTVEQWTADTVQLPASANAYLPGQYWFELDGKKSTTVVRVSVPVQAEGKLPVLFAFHGAGGSENMFFDAYGAGEIVSLSNKAGYVLVCPRQPLLGGVLSVEEMLGQLSNIVPIDTERVAVLGHSMGAAQTIAQVERGKPQTVRGAVILGGGRSISKPDMWRSIPVFAGAGERDFGKRGVQQFAASCRKEGGVVREEIYEAIEHLGIVQVALPDVFSWLEPLLQK